MFTDLLEDFASLRPGLFFHQFTYIYCFFFCRMKIDNATLKESMDSMEHLTASIHRLRLSLLKVSS